MTPEQIERQEGIEKAAVSLAEALRPRTSLYDIATEIAELIELQETAETDEVREALCVALDAYREKLPAKVDDIRGYIKHCEMMAECARQESAEQAQRAKLWGNRAQRTKDYALEVMQAFGAKKLSGRTGDLRMQANPASVEITREDILPMEFKKFQVSVNGKLFSLIVGFLDNFMVVIEKLSPHVAAALASVPWAAAHGDPDKTAIAAALKQPCHVCKGQKWESGLSCDSCSGRGTEGVPGARLVTDRSHLRL